MHRLKSVSPPDRQLIDALMDPAAFDHPVTSLELVETHISWVIVTDRYVYKIKKPVVLDFLDFGSVEKRKFFCEEELRLNKPHAPEIYIDVVPINCSNGRLGFNVDGDAVDYAVRMHPFDQDLRLDAQLAQDKLTVADMKELGQVVATRHAKAARVGRAQRGHQVAATQRFIRDNFAALDGTVEPDRLKSLSEWSERELLHLEPILWQRFDDGFVRDCHGDLHLANLVRLPGGIATFDCIEFDTDLRHIDVFCDIAFLVMDLVEKGRHDLASHFLNRYLERTGDYDGIRLLDLYFVYRCLVRAKVEAISGQESRDERDRKLHLAETDRYCDIAWRQATKRPPILVVMHGVSGSGKTWLAEQLMAGMPAVRLRSDVERKRMFGLDETAGSASGIGEDMYSEKANREVYAFLLDTARQVIASGHSVILDAAFLRRINRINAINVADDLGCAATLLHVRAPLETLKQRIAQRTRLASDASEADIDVLEAQLSSSEPLGEDEQARAVVCDNIGDIDVAGILTAIARTRH